MKTPEERLAASLARIEARYRARQRAFRRLTVGWGLAVALLAAFALLGCPRPGPAPVTPPDASDAAPAPPAVVSCASACANVVNTLGCKVDSQTCLGICARVKRDSYRTCIAAAKTCPDVDACGRP